MTSARSLSSDPAVDLDYPAQWETHAVLSDGGTVEIRPIRPDDRQALIAFHTRQSQESIYFRYFRHRPELTDKELDYFTQVDYEGRMAFVAMEANLLIAVARYEKLSDRPGCAEVAFFVDDEHHGRGLATLMLEYLAAAARANGFHRFTASVLTENYRMLAVFRKAGLETQTKFADGVIEVDIDLDVTPSASSIMASRHRRSRARSVARLMEPQTVAVIGAGRRPGTTGHEMVRAMTGALGPDSAFTGTVLAVNRAVEDGALIAGVPAFSSLESAVASLAEVGDQDGSDEDHESPLVDLAIVVVPADRVPDVVDDCGRLGVGGLVVVSSGFGVLEPDGPARSLELLETVRDNGMRMFGPSGFGVANTDPDLRLQAVALPAVLPTGPIALVSESGPLSAAIVSRLDGAGTGVRQLAGVGDQIDVSIADVLTYWATVDEIAVIVVYAEGFGEARALAAAARHTSLAKPIVAVTPAVPELARLLDEAGVILVDAVSQLSDQATIMATQPIPAGNRVAIVSNTSSLARLTRAACRRQGLEVVIPTSMGGIDGAGPAPGSVLVGDLDTVSVLPGITSIEYENLIVATGVDEGVDAIILALAPTGNLTVAELEAVGDRVNRSVDKPFAAVGLVDPVGAGSHLIPDHSSMPYFSFPEEAAEALGRYVRYGRWRAEAADAEDDEEAACSDLGFEELLGDRERRTLTPADVELPDVLGAMGLKLADYEVTSDESDLVAAGDRIGYPVVLKLPTLHDRSLGESAGTAIDLHDADALLAAHSRMTARWPEVAGTTMIQQMIDYKAMASVEVRAVGDLGFELMVGYGGASMRSIEPLERSFVPVAASRIEAMVEHLVSMVDVDRGDQAGAGVGGGLDLLRADLHAVIGGLAEAALEWSSIDRVRLNPILLTEGAAVPVDAEVVLSAPSTTPLDQVRHL